jgi:hypothetical protein
MNAFVFDIETIPDVESGRLIRGRLTELVYQQELELLRGALEQENKPHFREFLENWVAG